MVLKGNGKVYNFVIPEDTCIDAGQTFEFFPGDAAIGKYTVKVKTGSGRGAGTDAKVKLNIIGTKGQSRFRALQNKWYKNDFEKGSEDSFNITSADLGEITGMYFFPRKIAINQGVIVFDRLYHPNLRLEILFRMIQKHIEQNSSEMTVQNHMNVVFMTKYFIIRREMKRNSFLRHVVTTENQ